MSEVSEWYDVVSPHLEDGVSADVMLRVARVFVESEFELSDVDDANDFGDLVDRIAEAIVDGTDPEYHIAYAFQLESGDTSAFGQYLAIDGVEFSTVTIDGQSSEWDWS